MMQETILISIPLPQLQTLIIDCVNACLNVRTDTQPDPDRWLDLDELCDYHPDKPAKATVYGYVSANTIPYKKGPKKLRFLKSEIDNWLRQGLKKSPTEIDAETDAFLGRRKKREVSNA